MKDRVGVEIMGGRGGEGELGRVAIMGIGPVYSERVHVHTHAYALRRTETHENGRIPEQTV